MIEHSDGTFQGRYKKYFQDLQDRTESYKMLNYSLQQKAKKAFGENIFSNPELPADFDLNSLDGKFFEERQYIDYSMPYSDRMFQEFIDMKKTPVNSLFTYNTDNGKIVSGAYLIGKSKYDKPVLFALSVVRDRKDKNHFTINLQVSPQGKTWVDLVRLDNNDSKHLNYIVNNKLVASEEDLLPAPTPHIHKNCEMAQVLFHDNLTHTPCKHLPHLDAYLDSPSMLKESLDYFIKYTGLNIDYDHNLGNDLNFDFNHPLFTYSSLEYMDKPNTSKVL